MLRVKLFGIGRVLDGDTEVKLPSRNWTLPLLAYLVLHRDQTIPRWRLAFTLWPDETEEEALHNLRRKLHLLLRALPECYGKETRVLVDSENVAWNSGLNFELDVAEYERLRADPASLEHAVSLYSGDLLEEIYDDWVTAERERLRRLYHADLTRLIVGNRGRRAYGKAIGYAQQLLAADPWREDTLRQLMSARYESGDAAGALAEFDRFARLLRSEMNAEPMHETIALRDAIARGAPIPGSSDADKTAANREPLATPFVGRERELEQLHAFWMRAALGGGSLVLVRGDAGIGKSRLVSELALIVESEGGRVIEGATSSPERGPYESVAEALRQGLPMIAALHLPPAVLAAAAELVPELRTHRTELPMLAHMDERSERERLFDAIAQVLVVLARPRPLLVILEDVQWADAATLELIGLLAQRISGSPVFLVATSREGHVALPPALRSVARVTLGPLDPIAVAALAATIAPAEITDSDFARTIFERSGGNPLFATEMLRDAARGAYDAVAIPESIAAMIANRVESLDDATQTIAQVAAVAGAAFALDVVREATGFADAQVLAGLDELLDRHLIRESTEHGRFEYAFTHDLVRQAIYEAIRLDVRTRRHLRVGRVLENAYANEVVKPAVEIAMHYDRGGDALAAARWYLLAARRAASLYANVTARDLATRGLELTAGDDRLRFDLLLVRYEINVRLGEMEAHGADLAELNAISRRLDADAILTALRLNVDHEHDWGDVADELAAAARFCERAESSGEPHWSALATELQARAALRGVNPDQALAPALVARDLYGRLGDVPGRVRALTLASGAASGAGRNDEAVRHADEAMQIAATAGGPWLRLSALGATVALSYESQQYGRSADLAREQLRLGTEIGHGVIEFVGHANLALALWHLWCVDEALAHFRATVAMQQSSGIVYGAAFFTGFANLLGDLGDFDESIRMFEQAESVALRIGRPLQGADAANDSAYVWWRRGEIEPMRRALERALKMIAKGFGHKVFLTAIARNRALLMRHDGRFNESVALLESALGDLRGLHRPVDEIVAIDEIGATHLAARKIEQAVASVEMSEALTERLEDPRILYNRIAHHWIAAEVYRAAGDDARATAALNAARSSYEGRRDAIGDASLRASFEAIPLHRKLRAAFEGQ